MKGPGACINKPGVWLNWLEFNMTDRTCIVDDCERPRAKRQMCNRHYLRVRKHGTTERPYKCKVERCANPLEGKRQICDEHRYHCAEPGCESLRSGRSSKCKAHKNYGGAVLPAAPDCKICRTCKSEKPYEDFYETRSTLDGYQDRCIKCFEEYRLASRDKMQQWRTENANRLRVYRRLYASQNRAAKRANMNKRYISRSVISPEQLQQRIGYFGNRCWICRGQATEVDHVKPIAAGGPHLLANLRPICLPCNRWKNKKWPVTEMMLAEIRARVA